MKVILQPCGNSVAQKNFVDTIEKKIPVNDIYDDLSEIEQDPLKLKYDKILILNKKINVL